ncbi:RecQ familyATP-dependent DNA helicase [Escherichia coli]|nr:RecQ familyATP-dependent DNA helicase [Escherichia coli]
MPLKKSWTIHRRKCSKTVFHQCQNLDGGVCDYPSFDARSGVAGLNDIVDSAWTLTVLTALLRQAGCPTVYPLALASTSVKKLMNLSANAQATLLLTAIFLARRRVSINLLVIVEWGEVCIMAEAPTYQSRRASGAATARETYRLERSAYFSGAYSWLAGAWS